MVGLSPALACHTHKNRCLKCKNSPPQNSTRLSTLVGAADLGKVIHLRHHVFELGACVTLLKNAVCQFILSCHNCKHKTLGSLSSVWLQADFQTRDGVPWHLVTLQSDKAGQSWGSLPSAHMRWFHLSPCFPAICKGPTQ